MMSKDRVRFYLIDHSSHTNTQRLAQNIASQKAFKLSPHITEAAARKRVPIICRPSQFARFLIYRGEAGGQNLIKALEPVLYTPDQPLVHDVSGNPA